MPESETPYVHPHSERYANMLPGMEDISESKRPIEFGSPEYHKAVRRGEHPPAMFATAPEIFLTHHLGDADAYPSREDMVGDKLDEADSRAGMHPDDNEFGVIAPSQRQSGWYGGLSNRLTKYGYDWTKPITIRNESDDLTLVDGHHRLAVMLRDRPDEFIPLEYR